MEPKEEFVPLLPKRPEHIQPSGSRKLCILFACMYLHFMSMGFASSLGVVYVELLRYFETEKSVAALVQSVYQGLTCMGGVLFSRLVTKYSAGVPVLVASTTGVGSLFLSAWSVNIYMVIACIGVLGGLCMSVNYLCGFVSVGWTFQKNRRSAIAAITMATAASQTVTPILIGGLIGEYGWRGAMIVASGLMLNTVPCGLLLYKSKQYFNVTNHAGTSNLKLVECRSRRDIAVMICITLMAMHNGTGAVEAWFLVDLTSQRGISLQSGTNLLSVMGAMGLTGRALGIVFLRLCPTYSPILPMVGAFQVFAAAHLTIVFLTSYTGMLGGTLLRGLSMGFLMALQQVVLLELLDIDRFPKAVAASNCFIGISQIACGYLGGLIADVTGSYELAFYIAAGAASVCGLCMVVIKLLIR